jgi:hypothetical protein
MRFIREGRAKSREGIIDDGNAGGRARIGLEIRLSGDRKPVAGSLRLT